MEPECPLRHTYAPATCARSIQFMPPHPAIHTTCFNIQNVYILWTQRTVELGYKVMKETQYFILLKMSVVLTEEGKRYG